MDFSKAFRLLGAGVVTSVSLLAASRTAHALQIELDTGLLPSEQGWMYLSSGAPESSVFSTLGAVLFQGSLSIGSGVAAYQRSEAINSVDPIVLDVQAQLVGTTAPAGSGPGFYFAVFTGSQRYSVVIEPGRVSTLEGTNLGALDTSVGRDYVLSADPGAGGGFSLFVDGALVASQVTGGDGSYAFTSLPKGSYSLRVDPASLPPGMDASFDPDGIASLHEAAIDVDCDQVLLDQSFGYKVAPLLKVTPTLLSQSSGGSLQFALKAPSQAGALYLLFGSLSGVQPGIPLGGGLVLPLNWDAYSNFTAANPNSPPLANSVGTLGSLGQGSASFSVGPGQIPAPLLGALMHHAYVTLDLAGPQLSLVSNAVVTLFVP